VVPLVQPTVTIVATEKRPADAHEPVIASISSRGTAAAAAAMPAAMPLPAHLTDAATAVPIHTLSSKPGPEAALAKDTAPTSALPVPDALHEAKPDVSAARPVLSPYAAVSMAPTGERAAALKPAQDAALPAVSAPAPHAPHVAPVPHPIVIETVNAPAFTPGWQDETVNKLAHIVLTRNERAELKL